MPLKHRSYSQKVKKLSLRYLTARYDVRMIFESEKPTVNK